MALLKCGGPCDCFSQERTALVWDNLFSMTEVGNWNIYPKWTRVSGAVAEPCFLLSYEDRVRTVLLWVSSFSHACLCGWMHLPVFSRPLMFAIISVAKAHISLSGWRSMFCKSRHF
jgi:hypothetical protein